MDGRSFHRLTSVHNYSKPNDDRGLLLMDESAREVCVIIRNENYQMTSSQVMKNLGSEVLLSYGHRSIFMVCSQIVTPVVDSDEVSFVLRRNTTLFGL